VAAEAALGPAEQVVDEAEGGDPGDGQADSPRSADGPGGDERADEREPQPAVVAGERPTGERGVEELARAMCETRQVAPGRSMAQWQLDLLDPKAGADRVDRRADLAAEAGRRREARGAGRR
jgi:hypothetical protein